MSEFDEQLADFGETYDQNIGRRPKSELPTEQLGVVDKEATSLEMQDDPGMRVDVEKIIKDTQSDIKIIGVEKMEEELFKDLESLARHLIDNDDPRNARFYENPDDPEEHSPFWHQFGIITHSSKFSEYYKKQSDEVLEKWGFSGMKEEYLSGEIDGKSKEELLRIAIVLHDIGKFKRNFVEKPGGGFEAKYYDHEARGEYFVRNDSVVNGLLREKYSLTDAQIDYIASLVGLHFELGKLRRTIDKNEGYSLEFIRSEACKERCRKLMDEHPDFKFEMGLMFIFDSIAHSDIHMDAETDEEIEAQLEPMRKLIKEQGLNPNLINNIKSEPVDLQFARTYLEALRQ